MDEPVTSPFENPKLPYLPPPPPPNHSLLKPIVEEAPNKTISIQQLVRDAYTEKASDIHIRVGEIPRFRIRGEMVICEEAEKVTPAIFSAFLTEILSPFQRQQFAETKELDTAIFYPGFVRCRVNCFETLTGGAMVLRLITLEVPSIDSLGLPPV